MMRYLTAFAVLLMSAGLLLPTPTSPVRHAAPMVAAVATAQTPAPSEDLELIGGDPKLIKVAVTIEVDRQVVTRLPFSVRAPAGGIGYGWDWPVGVEVKRKGRVLEIIKAPIGPLSLGASWSMVTVVNGNVVPSDHYIEKTFHIADGSGPGPSPPPPPLPPPPPPPPTDDVLGFKALASAEGNKLPAAAKTQAGKVAGIFEECAKDSSQGVDFMLATLSMQAQKEGLRASGWGPWLDAWAAHARTLNQQGRLVTPAHHVQAFTDTAFGLRAVR